jgi:hypothetical protein
MDRYIFEAKADPHGIPGVLEQIAFRTAKAMRRAKHDGAYAIRLYQAFSYCAQHNEQTLEALQAYCAENARELSLRYPNQLADSYQELQKNLAPQIYRLMMH